MGKGEKKGKPGTVRGNQPPKPTQPPTLSRTLDEYQPKCGDTRRLGVNAGWLIPFLTLSPRPTFFRLHFTLRIVQSHILHTAGLLSVLKYYTSPICVVSLIDAQ